MKHKPVLPFIEDLLKGGDCRTKAAAENSPKKYAENRKCGKVRGISAWLEGDVVSRDADQSCVNSMDYTEEKKMGFTKTMSALALGSAGLMGAMNAHATWNLNAGDSLSITAGTTAFDANDAPYIANGSFFAVDGNKDSKILGVEKIALSQGSTGILIGAANTAPEDVTATWSFLGSPGYDWISTPVTGGTGGLDMSGWRVSWNYGNQIVLDTGAWQILNASSGMPTSGYSNGTGIFNWSGIYGDTYTLDYTATVQSGPFTGVQWAIHLEGTVVAVPEASTYGMMLAGLGLVGAAARRRKQSMVPG